MNDPAFADLVAAVGADAVLRGDAIDRRYTHPARGAGPGRAAALVRPHDVAGVAATVRWAVTRRRRLVIQGANTGLVGASTPDGTGEQVLLSLERLRTIRELDPVDRIVVVEAGVDLAAVQAALAPHGLHLPIDLGANPSVGGMVATNTGGARVLRHGDVRRRTVGVEVVLADPDATVVSDLRALRKDNARLDLAGLLVGSDGALGVVTAAAFEVARLPARRATAIVTPDGPDGALDLLLHLEAALGPQLTAFEAMSSPAMRAALAHVPDLADPFPGPPPALAVLVEVADERAGDDLAPGLADALASAQHARPAAVRDAVVVPPAVAWGLRHALTEGLTRSGHVLTFDVSVRRSRLPELHRRTRALAAELAPDAEVAEFGHWGDGGVHLFLVLPDDAPAATDPAAAARIRAAVDQLVDDLGGSFSAEHGLGRMNAASYRRLVAAPHRELAARVKAVLDPYGVLGTPPWVPDAVPAASGPDVHHG